MIPSAADVKEIQAYLNEALPEAHQRFQKLLFEAQSVQDLT